MGTDKTRHEPLSPVDTACLHIEDRTGLIVNVGAMVFAEPLDYERVKEALAERFLSFHRFRQRVVFPALPLGTPHWEDDPLFDLRSHLHRIALPGPGDERALREVLSDLICTPLDWDKPPWQVHLIEGYDAGTVLLFRLHHCLADGMALTQVVRLMTDRDPETPRRVPIAATPPPQGKRRARGLFGPLTAMVRSLLGGTDALVHKGIDTVLHPARGLELAGATAEAATVLGKLLLMGSDSPTVFNGPLGVTKRVAWTPPLPVKDIRAIGRHFESSINEVLLSAVTGALRRYLKNHGEIAPDIHLRVSIPVNWRQGESEQALGNRFSLNLLALPIDRDDPEERLAAIKQRVRHLERSSETAVIHTLMSVYGLAPAEIGNMVVPLFTRKATAVLSSVPGPPRTVFFAGKPIQRMMFWVPQPGRLGLGLGLSLMTYAGSVTLGVVADAGLVADPEAITDAFQEEIEQLKESLR